MKVSALDDLVAAPKSPASRYQRWRSGASTAIGTVAAVAVIAGAGNWFYNLSTRAAGDVPVIAAAAGKIKTRPEDPGGLKTRHKKITSFDAATPKRAMSIAHVAPAAPAPKPTDKAMAAYAARTAAAGIATAPAPAAAPRKDDGTATGSGPAPRKSAAPPRRPKNLAARMRKARAEIRADVGRLARRAARSPYQIQLAADPSAEVIEKIWRRVIRDNHDLLRNRARALQTTASGGVRYYRLRVGPFESPGEARAVCRALKARGHDCIVARNG